MSNYEEQPDNRPSLLGSVLSYEFPECSIASAELCMRANDLVVAKRDLQPGVEMPEKKSFYLPEYEDYRIVVVAKVHGFDNHFDLDGHNTSLVLAIPEKIEKPIQQVQATKRTGLLAKRRPGCGPTLRHRRRSF